VTRLRWTAAAAADLERIAYYLIEHMPENVIHLVRRIYEAPSVLITFPKRGRPGRKAGTRELVVPPLPYIVVYQLAGDVVNIVRILHGAQDWPQ
jgi:addiction module RelE/StbE family toxin